MHIDTTPSYLADFHAIKSGLAGCKTPWVQELRLEAMAHFELMGFPKPTDEQWKYTRTSALEKMDLIQKSRESHHSQYEAKADLIFLDGFCIKNELHEKKNITVHSLREILNSEPEKIKPYLGKIADYRERTFDALNLALMQDGFFIHIPAGTIIQEPIQCLFLTSESNENQPTYLRNILVMEEHSYATIVERYESIGGKRYFTHAVTEMSLGECVQLEHYKLQQESEQSIHIATMVVNQLKSSRFVSYAVSLGGSLVRNDIATELVAENAECDLNGLYLVNHKQHVDFHTLVDHIKPKGISRENYKGIINGNGRAVFNGKIVVHPDAQKTNAQLTNKNLLLSRTCEVDTKPELQIDADDVQCSHGATVGQLSDESLFYLRSRGIGESEGRKILTYAFAREIIDHMKLNFVREEIEKALEVSIV